jgi:hypothetical protein
MTDVRTSDSLSVVRSPYGAFPVSKWKPLESIPSWIARDTNTYILITQYHVIPLRSLPRSHHENPLNPYLHGLQETWHLHKLIMVLSYVYLNIFILTCLLPRTLESIRLTVNLYLFMYILNRGGVIN